VVTIKDPQVTIVVVPRERFSLAARSLQSIYEQSDVPFRLVYVDGGSRLESGGISRGRRRSVALS